MRLRPGRVHGVRTPGPAGRHRGVNIDHAFLDGVLDGSRDDVCYHVGAASSDPLLARLRDVNAVIMAGSGGGIKEFARRCPALIKDVDRGATVYPAP